MRWGRNPTCLYTALLLGRSSPLGLAASSVVAGTPNPAGSAPSLPPRPPQEPRPPSSTGTPPCQSPYRNIAQTCNRKTSDTCYENYIQEREDRTSVHLELGGKKQALRHTRSSPRPEVAAKALCSGSEEKFICLETCPNNPIITQPVLIKSTASLHKLHLAQCSDTSTTSIPWQVSQYQYGEWLP